MNILKTPDSVVRAAHARLTKQMGRAPTPTELARAAGMTHQTAAYRMKALGLARGQKKSLRIPDDQVKRAHEMLCSELGRAPTSTELAREIDLSDQATAYRMDALGLSRTRRSRSEAGRNGAEATNRIRKVRRARGEKMPSALKDETMEAMIRAEHERRMRYWAVANSGATDGQEPKRLPMPGEGLSPWDRQMIRCPICGREVKIAPRMHPWYMRDAGGAVRFLCSEQCLRGVDV